MSWQWHGGKGSKYRPVDKKQYDKNYDAIFGANKKKPVNKKTKKNTTKQTNGRVKTLKMFVVWVRIPPWSCWGYRLVVQDRRLSSS